MFLLYVSRLSVRPFPILIRLSEYIHLNQTAFLPPWEAAQPGREPHLSRACLPFPLKKCCDSTRNTIPGTPMLAEHTCFRKYTASAIHTLEGAPLRTLTLAVHLLVESSVGLRGRAKVLGHALPAKLGRVAQPLVACQCCGVSPIIVRRTESGSAQKIQVRSGTTAAVSARAWWARTQKTYR